ncbi:MAG: response regulator [Pararhodobacter sp.]|nr:response regulator [Pararhodobacter sp.]
MAECFRLAPSTPIDIAALLMLLVLALCLAWVGRNHRFHGKPFFMASMIGAMLWLGAVTLEHRAMTEACKVAWAQAAWLGIGLLPIALCFFFDDYARGRDRWRHSLRRLAITAGPLALFAMAATNAWHGQFYGPATGLVPGGEPAQVVYDHGPLFYIAAAWLYLFVIAGVMVLVRGLKRAQRAHRPFFLAWLLVLIMPVAANLGYVLGGVTVSGIDPTAYAYALAMMAFSWFVITDRMLDLRAVSLEVLWGNSLSPILIVLPDGAVASANPAALDLFGKTRAAGHLDDWTPLSDRASDLLSPALPERLPTLTVGERRFDVRILPVETPLDRQAEMGRVIALHEVTQREALEARLATERDYLQLLMQTTMTGIIAFDADGHAIFANAEAGKLAGIPADRIPGVHHAILFPPIEGDIEPGVARFSAVIGSTGRQRGLRVGFRRADGAARTLSVNVARLGRAGVEARTVCALADITEELETARSLEAARARAEAASRTKSQFLANMSHEIRTPLNGVLGMAELLENELTDPQARAMARIIRESGATLLSILNDVLDMSKIDAGKMHIEMMPFDPAQITARIAALHATAAQEKGLEFNVTGPGEDAPRRLGDQHRILQVVHNLVGNAIKFSETGSVTVRLDAAPGEPLRIDVRDTGIGMNPEQAARIFAEFEQGDGSVARRFGGTGLGMTITKALVDQMNGTIDLDTAPGRGTRVTVTLPLAEAAPEPKIAEASLAGAAGIRPLAGLTLLAADDNAVNRKLLSILLERAGARVRMVEGGRAALAEWQPGMFDAVLLDISMPDLDGVATLAALRAKAVAHGAEPPVFLAITANVMTHQIQEYRDAGFAGHAGKPFQSAHLIAEIQRAANAASAPQKTGLREVASD